MLADASLSRDSDATLADAFHCPRVPEQFVTSPLRLVGYSRWDERSDRFTSFFRQSFSAAFRSQRYSSTTTVARNALRGRPRTPAGICYGLLRPPSAHCQRKSSSGSHVCRVLAF